MKIIYNKNKLIKFIHSEKKLGFVPTMGALHFGHISLIKKSIYQCNKTVVSIFINKQQFNRNKDYYKYPRKLKRDIKTLKKLKVDYLYMPVQKEIYPKGYNKKIIISSFGKQLCGKFRPGHFKGVVDVIDRFLKIIRPRKMYLGEKDFQQLKIVQHFVKKNKFKTIVVGCKTIREKNGIAYSSRNLLLSSYEKRIASRVYKFIKNTKTKAVNNKITIKTIKDKIIFLGVKKIDYLKILDINKIIKPYKKNKKYKVFIAYYLGSTRLIDNI